MGFGTIALLLLNIVATSLTNVFIKLCKKDIPIFFAFIRIFVALIFFTATFFILGGASKGIDFSQSKLVLLFALCFSVCNIFSVFALKTGPLGITGFVMSFSLIIPTLYGIIFLKENVGAIFYIAIALFVLSLLLVNVDFSKKKGKEKVQITAKWVAFLSVAALTNGLCSVILTMAGQQEKYPQNTKIFHSAEFMLMALVLSALIILLSSLIFERKKLKGSIKFALIPASLTGFCTGIQNVLTMAFTGLFLMPVAIYFPVLSGAQLILCFIFGRLIFKERYSPIQYVGIIIGLASVILLNL